MIYKKFLKPYSHSISPLALLSASNLSVKTTQSVFWAS